MEGRPRSPGKARKTCRRVRPAPRWSLAASPATDASPRSWPRRRRKRTTPRSSDPRRASIPSRITTPTPGNHATKANTSHFSPDFFSSLLARALCVWMKSVWLLLGSGPRHRSGRFRLDFLSAWPFRCEGPAYECWIVLDFLGFSRPNLDFSMGYAACRRKLISRALFRRRSAGTGACGLGMRKRRIVHGASLTQFLFICKRLSSEPFPFRPPQSNRNSL
jgi:hypothetical protein